MARSEQFTFAHTNPNGTGAAQKVIESTSLKKATAMFHQLLPQRVITATGRVGVEG